MIDAVVVGRWQFAFSIMFHGVFAFFAESSFLGVFLTNAWMSIRSATGSRAITSS
jgi:cytochrome bd-type quinol oxidase subunit 1